MSARAALHVPAGRGRRLMSAAHEVVFKVTGEHSSAASSFEVLVPPGFDVGAHRHQRSEELFYVVEGSLTFLGFDPVTTDGHWTDWRSADGDRPVTAGPGDVVFVPPGCAHAFMNAGDEPAKMFFQAAPPPDHEAYFEGLIEIFSRGRGPVDARSVEVLRADYDIEQLTELRFDPPDAADPGQVRR